MNTKIDKLVRSSCLDDVVLGCFLAYTQLGEDWMKKNFIFDNERWLESPYRTNNLWSPEPCPKNMAIGFPSFDVYIGPIALEVVPKNYIPNKIVTYDME